MRLFIGVTFEEKIQKEIDVFTKKLKQGSMKGNFTSKENFHLTLAFLGEIDENCIVKIEESMRDLSMAPFTIELDKMGTFKGKGGDIYWLGFKESCELQNLYHKLSEKLRKNGFYLDKRPYTPHLTLGRKIVLNEEIGLHNLSGEIPNLQIEVAEIHLILSHRIDGKLTYTPIRTKNLS